MNAEELKRRQEELANARPFVELSEAALPRMVDVQLVPGGEVHRVLIPGEVGETIDFCPAHDKLVVRKESA